MRADAAAMQIRVLDGPALRALSTELNSSKYAIDAHNRSIQELGNLSELPKLCALDVSFNKITSLRNISTARELRELKIYNNRLTTTVGLKANSNLEGLLLHDNRIEEISPDFLALVRLKNLWLNGNRIATVQNLRSCRLLMHLDLGRNQLQGTASEGLEALTNLEHLNLTGNQLSSVGNLAHLTKLEELNLSENNLSSLQGLLPPNLIVLRVNANQLSSFQSLSTTLSKLNELYAHDNAISSLEPIPTRFPQLESLDLRNNHIRSSDHFAVLSKFEGLQDLWLEGNPCCSSSSYLLDIATALPELKTLDAFTDAQLHSHLEGLKNGTLSQEALLRSARATTPAYRPGSSAGRPRTPSFRPGSASARPGSSSGLRPATPCGRPTTPDSPPVFHKPSARIGNLVKLTTPAELAKAEEEVRDRLQKMKQLLRRVGSSQEEEVPIPAKLHRRHSVASDTSEATSKVRLSDLVTRVEARSTTVHPTKLPSSSPSTALPPATSVNSATGGAEQLPKTFHRARTVQSLIRRLHVDAGTDPFESLMGYNKTTALPAPGRGHEIETQTTLPPPPVVVVSMTGENREHGQLNDQAVASAIAVNAMPEATKSHEVPQQDGDSLGTQMELFLLQHAMANSPLDDNQDTNDGQPESEGDDTKNDPNFWTNSLPMEPTKTAEQRKPPNSLSRQGYRRFRVPSRPSSATGE